MLEMLLLETIVFVSLIYALFLVFITVPPQEQFLLFMGTVLVTVAVAALARKSRLFELGFVLLFLPLYLYPERVPAYFVVLTAVFVYIYVRKSLLKGSHHDYVTNLKKAVFVFFIATYVRSLLDTLIDGSLWQASPFIVLFLFSSVLLIRSIRHLDSSLGIKKIRRDNLKYTAMMLVVFAIATLEQFQEFMRSLGHRVINLLAFPVYLLVKLIEDFINLISRIDNSNPNRERVRLVPEAAKPREMIGEIISGESELLDLSAAERILAFIFIVALLYILYQVLVKHGERDEGLAYTEAREYISEREERKKVFWRDRYPAEFGQQIRYYYRRYLDKLRSAKIALEKSDTSLDVNIKAEPNFGEGIDNLRKIYIESRYGEKEVDQDTVQEIKQLYRDL